MRNRNAHSGRLSRTLLSHKSRRKNKTGNVRLMFFFPLLFFCRSGNSIEFCFRPAYASAPVLVCFCHMLVVKGFVLHGRDMTKANAAVCSMRVIVLCCSFLANPVPIPLGLHALILNGTSSLQNVQLSITPLNGCTPSGIQKD